MEVQDGPPLPPVPAPDSPISLDPALMLPEDHEYLGDLHLKRSAKAQTLQKGSANGPPPPPPPPAAVHDDDDDNSLASSLSSSSSERRRCQRNRTNIILTMGALLVAWPSLQDEEDEGHLSYEPSVVGKDNSKHRGKKRKKST
jgi:hypothetical protein